MQCKKNIVILALISFGIILSACAVPVQQGRLAQIIIYDRDSGSTLPVYQHQGKYYIVGTPGHEYQIALKNHSGRDILAIVSVDGINVITGQTAAYDQSGYVFVPGEQYSIQGWRKNQYNTAAFYFTSVSHSYAGRTGRGNQAGVIGVAIFQRKATPRYAEPLMNGAPVDKSRFDSMESASVNKKSNESLGTGHGRIENSAIDYVNFERASRQPAEILTIYYDSYANLKQRGIIPSNPVKPEVVQPFPGEKDFVPDPPLSPYLLRR